MALKQRYNEVMDHIVVTDDMRARMEAYLDKYGVK